MILSSWSRTASIVFHAVSRKQYRKIFFPFINQSMIFWINWKIIQSLYYKLNIKMLFINLIKLSELLILIQQTDLFNI